MATYAERKKALEDERRKTNMQCGIFFVITILISLGMVVFMGADAFKPIGGDNWDVDVRQIQIDNSTTATCVTIVDFGMQCQFENGGK